MKSRTLFMHTILQMDIFISFSLMYVTSFVRSLWFQENMKHSHNNIFSKNILTKTVLKFFESKLEYRVFYRSIIQIIIWRLFDVV